jgi:hypothetical protein
MATLDVERDSDRRVQQALPVLAEALENTDSMYESDIKLALKKAGLYHQIRFVTLNKILDQGVTQGFFQVFDDGEDDGWFIQLCPVVDRDTVAVEQTPVETFTPIEGDTAQPTSQEVCEDCGCVFDEVDCEGETEEYTEEEDEEEIEQEVYTEDMLSASVNSTGPVHVAMTVTQERGSLQAFLRKVQYVVNFFKRL